MNAVFSLLSTDCLQGICRWGNEENTVMDLAEDLWEPGHPRNTSHIICVTVGPNEVGNITYKTESCSATYSVVCLAGMCEHCRCSLLEINVVRELLIQSLKKFIKRYLNT